MAFTLTWLGHGTSSLSIGGFSVVIDPFFADNPAASTTVDQVEADFILVSHGHYDHVNDVEPLAKRTGALVISNPEIASWFAAKGLKTHAQPSGGWHTHPFGQLKLTKAEHGSKLPDDTNGGNAAGLLIEAEGKKIYLACDTALFDDMKLICAEGLDLAVLPIGGKYTMDPEDALKAVNLLMPKHVIPVHYSTWDVITQDAQSWAQRVEKETTAKAHVLKPGESLDI